MNAHTHHRGQFVIPDKTITLMQSLGATRAARELGVSTTLLYTARQNGEVSKVVEVAAEGALQRQGRPLPKPRDVVPPQPAASKQEPTVLCLLEVEQSKLPIVTKLADKLGAEILVH